MKKNFVRKNGEPMDFKEFYLQQSVQDYFIKFCESNVTWKELEEELSKIDSDIKALTLEVEFREGYWDICNDDRMQQSRVGKYLIIHRIISK